MYLNMSGKNQPSSFHYVQSVLHESVQFTFGRIIDFRVHLRRLSVFPPVFSMDFAFLAALYPFNSPTRIPPLPYFNMTILVYTCHSPRRARTNQQPTLIESARKLRCSSLPPAHSVS